MKKFFKSVLFALSVMAMTAGFLSCEADDPSSKTTNNDVLYQSILEKYVNTTILPTYKSMAEAALEMRTANEALKNNPTDAAMKAASDAWMKTRIIWEMSEAFLFGPVGENALNIDAHIDSWPLEMEEINLELDAIEKDLAAGGRGLSGEKAWEMEEQVIGFHVTEYLLYRDGKSRPANNLTRAELSYLTAATDALAWDCILAYAAWIGEDNLPSNMKSVYNENPAIADHLHNSPTYMDFAKKLKTSEGYSSWGAALCEIPSWAANIAAEVSATKINDPYVRHDVTDVESWYSWHSLDDYVNNILSIKNAYLGGMDDQTRVNPCLSTYVAQLDVQLDKDIKAKIEDCISKIRNMGKGGKSFYEVVRDQINKEEVDAAIEACAELESLFANLAERIE